MDEERQHTENRLIITERHKGNLSIASAVLLRRAYRFENRPQ